MRTAPTPQALARCQASTHTPMSVTHCPYMRAAPCIIPPQIQAWIQAFHIAVTAALAIPASASALLSLLSQLPPLLHLQARRSQLPPLLPLQARLSQLPPLLPLQARRSQLPPLLRLQARRSQLPPLLPRLRKKSLASGGCAPGKMLAAMDSSALGLGKEARESFPASPKVAIKTANAAALTANAAVGNARDAETKSAGPSPRHNRF